MIIDNSFMIIKSRIIIECIVLNAGVNSYFKNVLNLCITINILLVFNHMVFKNMTAELYSF